MEIGGEAAMVDTKVVVTRHPGVPPSAIEQAALDEKIQIEKKDPDPQKASEKKSGEKKSLEKNQVFVGEAKADKPLNDRRRPITSAYNSKITF